MLFFVKLLQAFVTVKWQVYTVQSFKCATMKQEVVEKVYVYIERYLWKCCLVAALWQGGKGSGCDS